jgi:hypothetical protein
VLDDALQGGFVAGVLHVDEDNAAWWRSCR